MEQSQLMIDLSALIEYRINQRNELAKKRPRPDGIIQIIDRELDILEKVEIFIDLMECRHAISLIERAKKSFYNGKQAGFMLARTGRNHDEYFSSF